MTKVKKKLKLISFIKKTAKRIHLLHFNIFEPNYKINGFYR